MGRGIDRPWARDLRIRTGSGRRRTRAVDAADGDKFVTLGPAGPVDESGKDDERDKDDKSGMVDESGEGDESGAGDKPDKIDESGEVDKPDEDDEPGKDDESGEVLDIVSYCGLVPGTEYTIDGEIQVLSGSAPPSPSGVTGTTTFVPTATCGDANVVFTIPAGSELIGHVGVVYERLSLTATGTTVAEHSDPNDRAQTLYFPLIDTELRLGDLNAAGHLVAAGDPVIDVITYSGLAPGERYRADLTLYERGPNGRCTATDISSSQDFTTTESSGVVIVAGVNVPQNGVYVGYERVYRIGDSDDPGNESSNGDYLVATHEDCDDPLQTIWALGMDTSVARPSVIGAGEMTDTIKVSGLADGLPEGMSVRVAGGLHRHRSQWVCNDDNKVADFSIDVETDGEYRSPGERHGIGWYSYDNWYVVTFADGTTWESARFGCTVESESFEALTPTVPSTSSIPPTTEVPVAETPPVAEVPIAPPQSEPPATTVPPPRLPKTGSGDLGVVQLLAVLLVLAGGTLYLAKPVLPLPLPRHNARQRFGHPIRRIRDLCQQLRPRQR